MKYIFCSKDMPGTLRVRWISTHFVQCSMSVKVRTLEFKGTGR